MTATQKYKTVAASLLEADHIDRIISYEVPQTNWQIERRVVGRLSGFLVSEENVQMFFHQFDRRDSIPLDTAVNIFREVDAQ